MVATAVVVDGVAAVDVVAPDCAAGSDDFELHAPANNAATARAPATSESLRITTPV